MAMTSNLSITLAWKLFKAIKTTQQQKPGLKPGFLINGAKETRTPDPLHAMQVLYQLSYGPIVSDQAIRLPR